MPRTLHALAFLIALLAFVSGAHAANQQLFNACFGNANEPLKNDDTIKIDKAIKACTQILAGKQSREAEARALHRRGNLYVTKDEYDRAIADYTRAIELEPTSLRYLARSWAYYKRPDYANADQMGRDFDLSSADRKRAVELMKIEAARERASQPKQQQVAVEPAKPVEAAPAPAPAPVVKPEVAAPAPQQQSVKPAKQLAHSEPVPAEQARKTALAELDEAEAAAKVSAPQEQAAIEPAKPVKAPVVKPEVAAPVVQPEATSPAPVVQPAAAPAAIPQGKRVALVVGNDDYEGLPDLNKAVNDAHAVGAALTKLGFEVLTVDNASRAAMIAKLVEFTNKIERGGTGFFFYAGHGVQLRGTNYLLPVDTPEAREGQEGLITGNGIAADTVLQEIQGRGARVAMLVLDACRDNPFARPGQRGVGGTRGLTLMTVPEGVFVIYSAGVGETALDRLTEDDTNPNSVFTRTFVSLLDQPGLTLHDIAKRTQRNVYELAKGVSHTQMPAYYDQILGELTLLPRH